MSLRVVLFTRSSRPSGAQMAWRLFQAGIPPVAVLVEKRGRMRQGKGGAPLSLLRRFGIGFLWKRFWEAAGIKTQFYARKFLKDRYKNPVYLSVEEWALDHPTVRVYHVEDHQGAETRELLWRLEPDVGVLTNTRRIKKEILQTPRHGFLNLHLSLLPQYAGLDSIFWALYHGEKQIGATVHFASEEIDRGDTVLQRKIPVSSFDTEDSLYEKALWVGTHLMVEALRGVESGALQGIPQHRLNASYFSWPTPRQRRILRKRLRVRQGRTSEVSPKGPRVLHLITRMTRGGAQENTLATLQGLRKRGYEVTLVTGPSWGEEGEILSEALAEGLDVVMLPELVRDPHPWKDLASFRKLIRWFARDRYDIIHTHSSKAGFLGRLAGRLRKIPVVHTPHGHVFHSYFPPWKERLFLSAERIAARWSDRLIALTERCRLEHLERGVGTPEKWVTIPSGVDEKSFDERSALRQEMLNEFGLSPGQKIIGFIGRLAPVKGVRYLVEALPPIFEAVPEAHCFIVGDGEERMALKRQMEELGLGERVTFPGHRRDIAGFLSLFDVLVVPSLNEGMGRVIAEGGLLRKAVVGTKVGGIPELIEEGETGILVEPRNSGEIVRSVIRLLKDPEFSQRLGERLRERVLKGFTESQMMEKIHALYQEVLGRKNSLEEFVDSG